jgi:hypothetical protein
MAGDELFLLSRNILLLLVMVMTVTMLPAGTIDLPGMLLSIWARYRAKKHMMKGRKPDPKPGEYREIDLSKFE